MTARQGHLLSVQLTLGHSQLILQALAELPFKTVFELIGQLNQQTHRLFSHDAVDSERMQTFVLSASDLALCIKALGEMPFKRVSALLSHLNREILEQRNLHHNSSEKVVKDHGRV
jgi:hypothetical protein